MLPLVGARRFAAPRRRSPSNPCSLFAPTARKDCARMRETARRLPVPFGTRAAAPCLPRGGGSACDRAGLSCCRRTPDPTPRHKSAAKRGRPSNPQPARKRHRGAASLRQATSGTVGPVSAAACDRGGFRRGHLSRRGSSRPAQECRGCRRLVRSQLTVWRAQRAPSKPLCAIVLSVTQILYLADFIRSSCVAACSPIARAA